MGGGGREEEEEEEEEQEERVLISVKFRAIAKLHRSPAKKIVWGGVGGGGGGGNTPKASNGLLYAYWSES